MISVKERGYHKCRRMGEMISVEEWGYHKCRREGDIISVEENVSFLRVEVRGACRMQQIGSSEVAPLLCQVSVE